MCCTPTCAPTRCCRSPDTSRVLHHRRALVITAATFARQRRHVITVAVTTTPPRQAAAAVVLARQPPPRPPPCFRTTLCTECERGSAAQRVFRQAVNTIVAHVPQMTTNYDVATRAADARDHNADHTSDVQRVLVCKRTTSKRRKTGAQCVQQERQLRRGNVPLRRVATRVSVRTSLSQVGQHFASHASNDV